MDARCKELFAELIRQAGRGELQGPCWRTASGLLAQVILLDQLSRNAFRGTPEAFAYDARALAPQLFPAALTPMTAQALSRAESPTQALALLLVSPEMMRR